MIVAIPSKGRAGKVRSQAILPSASVFVPKLEAAAYRKAGAKNVVEVPDTVRGITATRNWILKHTKDRRVVMIDDDVRAHGFTRLYERHAVHEPLDEKTWLGEFVKLFEITEQLGFRIWGTRTDSATRAAYPYFPFRFRSYVTASCMGIVNAGRVAFDETYPVKEDYELCARCITEDGGVLSISLLAKHALSRPWRVPRLPDRTDGARRDQAPLPDLSGPRPRRRARNLELVDRDRMSRWQACHVRYGSDDFETLLEQGWEPFAVTVDEDGAEVWLRRKHVRESDEALISGIVRRG